MVMRTDTDPIDGFYVPSWGDGGGCGITPSEAMKCSEAELGHVYLMWHIDDREIPPNFAVSEAEVRNFLDLNDAKLVVRSDLDRIIMVDDCHTDELKYEKCLRRSK